MHALVIARLNRSEPNPMNTWRSGTRSSRSTSLVTASNSSGGGCTHLAVPPTLTRPRRRASVRAAHRTSPQVRPLRSPIRIPSRPRPAAAACSATASGRARPGCVAAVGGFTSLRWPRGSFTSGSRTGFGCTRAWSRIIASTFSVLRIDSRFSVDRSATRSVTAATSTSWSGLSPMRGGCGRAPPGRSGRYRRRRRHGMPSTVQPRRRR